MLYENKICAGCGLPMTEADDVVVCPECGTPQHRACWQKENHCVNEQRHAEGYEWADGGEKPMPEQAAEKPAEKPAHESAASDEADGGEMTCPYCGEVNKADALHCQSCGAPFAMGPLPPYGNAGNPYMRNINMSESEPLGSTTAGEAASYVGPGSHKYIPKFKRMADRGGKGFSWNWAAFFLSPFWFFYRKLNKAGVFATAVLLAITLFSTPYLNDYLNDVSEAYAPYTEEINSGAVSDAALEDISVKVMAAFEAHSDKLLLIAAAHMLLHIACALIANQAYYKKMIEDIKLIKEASADDDMSRFITVRRGGTAFLNFILGYCGYNLLISLIARFIG